jgi:hypothetical protein
MIKTALVFMFALMVSACSGVTVTAAMCDQIANDPSAPPIPKECKDYNEKEAQKAFNKVVDEKKVSDQDIEFSREK